MSTEFQDKASSVEWFGRCFMVGFSPLIGGAMYDSVGFDDTTRNSLVIALFTLGIHYYGCYVYKVHENAQSRDLIKKNYIKEVDTKNQTFDHSFII